MKNIKKKIFSILCSASLIATGMTVHADKAIGNYTYGCFTYNINSDESITLISCDSDVVSVEIPVQIEGMPVSDINGSTFQGCNRLTEIIVSEDNIYFDVNESGMLTNKSGTKLIKCPSSMNTSSYTIPSDVKIISPYCFENCIALSCINIPESVTSIGKNAFYGTGFSNVTLLNPSVSIGSQAFGYCDDGKITDLTIYGLLNSTASKYVAENDISFVATDHESFNISVNGNLYFYNDDKSFDCDKIKVVKKDGQQALYSFSQTPAQIFDENGTAASKVDVLSILNKPITYFTVRVAMAGDANADGMLNVRDAAFTATKLAKGVTFAEFEKMCADKNKDGKADIRDAAEIARELSQVK